MLFPIKCHSGGGYGAVTVPPVVDEAVFSCSFSFTPPGLGCG
ncbi:hypothetical protein KCQ_12635 [Pectobacterium atrosepticum ICMP 1526]|nr:hypothetical protein KCQ_12635 [Pectobacterium atrosepticum ICMP 1526]